MEFVFIAMKPNLNKPLNIADEKKRFVVVIKKMLRAKFQQALKWSIKVWHQQSVIKSNKCWARVGKEFYLKIDYRSNKKPFQYRRKSKEN